MSDGEGKAEGHDVGLWACMCRLLSINADGAESPRDCWHPTLFVWSGLQEPALSQLVQLTVSP